MKTVIWVPFRGDDGGWRDRNFAVVKRQVDYIGARLDADVLIHDSGDIPFSIARTWNELGQMGDWDAALCWGADFVMVDALESVKAALKRVDQGSHYVFAFDKVSTLDRRQTLLVHTSGTRQFATSPLPFGGIRAISREMWEGVGGYDPRFKGWGHEDRAHVHGVELLYGPRQRVPGHMLNLWHPKRTNTREHDAQDEAYFRRVRANKRLLAEVREISTPRAWSEYLAQRGQ